MTDKRQHSEKNGTTGAGSESAEGIHSDTSGRASGDRSAVEGASKGDEPGSEPLKDRKNPKGSYGGEGGKPRKPPPQDTEE